MLLKRHKFIASRWVKYAILASGLFAVSACQVLEIQFPPRKYEKTVTEAQSPQTYVSLGFGIAEFSKPQTYNCPKGPEKVVLYRSVKDSILHFLIGGVYTARTIEVHCRK